MVAAFSACAWSAIEAITAASPEVVATAVAARSMCSLLLVTTPKYLPSSMKTLSCRSAPRSWLVTSSMSAIRPETSHSEGSQSCSIRAM